MEASCKLRYIEPLGTQLRQMKAPEDEDNADKTRKDELQQGFT